MEKHDGPKETPEQMIDRLFTLTAVGVAVFFTLAYFFASGA